jgi:hypothetical protein
MAASFSIDNKDRQQRIAEAAYFRAEQRGFNGGDSVSDWLLAEREVDAQLSQQEHHEHRHLLGDLEERLESAGKKLSALKKKASGLTADARKELEQDVQKLAKLRDNLQSRVEEIRAQGADASHKARQQAERLWADITQTLERLSTRQRKAK